MIKKKINLKNIKKLYIVLIGVCILCFILIFYERQKTMCCYFNEEVYVDEVQEDKIIVKGLPYTTGNFIGQYIIQINDSLIIKDSNANIIDSYSLERGDILLFDYSGSKNLKPDNGAVLNGKRLNAYNFRVSDEKLNLKFWRLE